MCAIWAKQWEDRENTSNEDLPHPLGTTAPLIIEYGSPSSEFELSVGSPLLLLLLLLTPTDCLGAGAQQNVEKKNGVFPDLLLIIRRLLAHSELEVENFSWSSVCTDDQLWVLSSLKPS